MERNIKIIVSALLSLLVFTAGIARFHHHESSDHRPCFCMSITADNHHTHTSADDGCGSSDDDSCPLHIDLFKITEPQKIISHDHHYGHIHCDLCSPSAFVINLNDYITLVHEQDIPILYLFERSTFVKRGPPSIA